MCIGATCLCYYVEHVKSLHCVMLCCLVLCTVYWVLRIVCWVLPHLCDYCWFFMLYAGYFHISVGTADASCCMLGKVEIISNSGSLYSYTSLDCYYCISQNLRSYKPSANHIFMHSPVISWVAQFTLNYALL